MWKKIDNGRGKRKKKKNKTFITWRHSKYFTSMSWTICSSIKLFHYCIMRCKIFGRKEIISRKWLELAHSLHLIRRDMTKNIRTCLPLALFPCFPITTNVVVSITPFVFCKPPRLPTPLLHFPSLQISNNNLTCSSRHTTNASLRILLHF